MNHRALHRRRHPVTWIVLSTTVLVILDIGAWVAWALVHLVDTLAPAFLLGAAAVVGWRWWHRRGILPPQRRGKVLRGRAEPDHTADLEAERDELCRQVAKLEADAARHDALVEHLEAVAGRPVEAVIASFEHMQRIYRTEGP